EAGAGAGVRDVDPLAGLRPRAGDAVAELPPDLPRRSLGDLAPQLVPLAIEDEEGTAVSVDHLGRLVDDEGKEKIQVACRGHGLGDVEDGGELLDASGEVLRTGGVRAHARKRYSSRGTGRGRVPL